MRPPDNLGLLMIKGWICEGLLYFRKYHVKFVVQAVILLTTTEFSGTVIVDELELAYGRLDRGGCC